MNKFYIHYTIDGTPPFTIEQILSTLSLIIIIILYVIITWFIPLHTNINLGFVMFHTTNNYIKCGM
jgi:hypothetical protein